MAQDKKKRGGSAQKSCLKLFLILTTIGRKSGLARHTALEYHTFEGRIYVMAAWPRSDWYQNILADPHVTIQTAQGTERAIARRLTSDEELSQAFEFAEQSPVMRKLWQALGFDLSLEEFLAQKEHFHLITFDPTTESTPPPLEADLKWVWWLVLASGFLGWRLGCRSRR